MVVNDDHSGEDAARVHSDENFDRAVVASLERFKFRRPESKADQRFSRSAGRFPVHAEMRRRPSLGEIRVAFGKRRLKSESMLASGPGWAPSTARARTTRTALTKLRIRPGREREFVDIDEPIDLENRP